MTDETSEPELPRAIALAWGVAANPQRGPKREMSIEKIVDAAIEIADAEGLGAVSMTRVAQALGFTTMSLYRYVTSKDDLVALMAEAGTGLPPEPEDGLAGWRERIRFLFRAQLGVFLRHPWLLDVPIVGSPVTPNSVAWMDALLDAVAEAPVDEGERIGIALLVTGQVRWQGIVERSYNTAAADAGVDAQTIDDTSSRLYEELITAEEFPAMRRAVDAGVFSDPDADPLAFGFERLLDGIAAYLDARAAGTPAPEAPAEPDEPAAVTADKKVREARKQIREAEKALRQARKLERQMLKDARQRLG
ncbi:TetR/AcrR family transcriptional regulator [Agromyces archimandritae]|uniref:TetR/AcrR family transcriptional regulator C-terminal domain-containing protein n=1 Tax=Agromyces archimandritae TaxID=2781962 RepID=A0A975FMH0_9MICO|nr:TetR/AcrR family transcriptional regulator [Agromyces archimandritae]QTX05160.1 TetR/AcrR family transcriptional regulator C-terminal domain-containing protein [Agromyces archimandritae]